MPEMDLRQIDALVAEKVMGMNVEFVGWVAKTNHLGDGICTGEKAFRAGGAAIPPFSSEIAAAWQVMEKMKERKLYASIECHSDYYEATVYNEHGTWYWNACADTAPFAICLAALRAVGVEVTAMPEYRPTTARKEHTCSLCFGSIPAGSQYISQRLGPHNSENEYFFTYRAHPDCHHTFMEVLPELDEPTLPCCVSDWQDLLELHAELPQIRAERERLRRLSEEREAQRRQMAHA